MSPRKFTFNQASTGAAKEPPGKKQPDRKEARKVVLAERRRVAAILAQACPLTVAEAARLACFTDTTAEEAGLHLMAARKRATARARKEARAPDALPPELKAVQQRLIRHPQK
ncbi:hypothetical protein [Pararhodobacter aggregans]|uniref:Uncharacterized protein n=1 Tax=Pararhodobacter aggregans TaxID=404875 RepID=A0A2T7ULY3_9RHOB|nr:hypothetical protein [Pararhodobacter aggregans]PTW99071.1 hypothetical protein C8N33_11857 [Pararhodobacter aggregans]PVE45631.1 hypothetical protein DDE23_20420 [Pararhodobacter aggregans]